jgi:hypothetical protein
MTLKSEIDQFTEKSQKLRLENAALTVHTLSALCQSFSPGGRLFIYLAFCWYLIIDVVTSRVVQLAGETQECATRTHARNDFKQH